MSIESNGQGQSHYRCKHRGKGCKLPARSNRGLVTAAVLAMELLCDEELQSAIRRVGSQNSAASGTSCSCCTSTTRSRPISSASNRPA
ncbi:hypothetical protein [Candidatus Microthrix parvicella]|uniref:hypothetical protein n=1 Tax=Candidatus Neomicrothrix parvicella TaxID=41950 RepID=UPI003B96805D